MISPRITITGNIIPIKQVIFCNIYVYTYKYVHAVQLTKEEAMNLKDHIKRTMERFRGRKGNGEIV